MHLFQKMTSIHLVLTYANHHNLDIVSFDCKTAFLHVLLGMVIYAKQIPGYPLANLSTVYQIWHAIYGLRQSAYEFYVLIWSILVHIGLQCCEVDYAVFYRRWTSPPHASITMPEDGSDLILIVPVHVDDGLVATNSLPLYQWFLSELNKEIEVIDQGPVQLYLGMHISRNRSKRKLWISQKAYIIELLKTWNLTDATERPVPLRQKLHDLPPAPANTLPEIRDDDLTVSYQRLVGSLIYLAVMSRPNIAYVAMALGKYNSKPTRTYMLAAKGVLCYLKGTMDLALEFGFDGALHPDSTRDFIPSYVDAHSWTQIGPQTRRTGRASRDSASFSLMPLLHGQLLDSGQSLCHQQNPSTMPSPMQ